MADHPEGNTPLIDVFISGHLLQDRPKLTGRQAWSHFAPKRFGETVTDGQKDPPGRVGRPLIAPALIRALRPRVHPASSSPPSPHLRHRNPS